MNHHSHPASTLRATSTPWLFVFVLSSMGLLASCSCDQENLPGIDAKPDAGLPIKETEKPRKLTLHETEPNNNPGQATAFTLKPTAPGSPLFKPFHGTLKEAQDVDWYRIPALQEEKLRTLTLRPSSKDPKGDLALVWSGNAEHMTDLQGDGKAEKVLNLRPNQEVVVGVTRGQNAGPGPLSYTLSMGRSAQPLGALEAEPNGEQGHRISMPGTVQGLVNHRGDVDLYRLEEGKEPGEALRLEFRPSPEVGFLLCLKDKDGRTLERIQIEASDEPLPLIRPNMTIPEGGIMLEVAAEGEKPGTARAYTLSALYHAPVGKDVALETEPNDAKAPLTIQGAKEIKGYIHLDEDNDAFLVTVPQPTSPETPIVFHAELLSQSRDLTLGWKGGLADEKIWNVDKVGAKKPEMICNRVVKPGQVYLKVSPSSKSRKDTPEEVLDGGLYHLLYTLRPANQEEVEPNARLQTATSLLFDQPYKGFLFPAGDVDVWSFDLEVPEDEEAEEEPTKAVSIEMTSPGVNAALELVDEDGAPIARRDSRGAGEGESLKVDLPSGKYFVKARVQGKRVSCEEPYLLTVKTL